MDTSEITVCMKSFTTFTLFGIVPRIKVDVLVIAGKYFLSKLPAYNKMNSLFDKMIIIV